MARKSRLTPIAAAQHPEQPTQDRPTLEGFLHAVGYVTSAHYFLMAWLVAHHCQYSAPLFEVKTSTGKEVYSGLDLPSSVAEKHTDFLKLIAEQESLFRSFLASWLESWDGLARLSEDGLSLLLGKHFSGMLQESFDKEAGNIFSTLSDFFIRSKTNV